MLSAAGMDRRADTTAGTAAVTLRDMVTTTDFAAVTLSALALVTSLVAAIRQLRLAKQSNSLPVLVDLFREHRGHRLAQARDFVFHELPGCDVSRGLAGLPEDERELVRDLAWFYDNLGALVAHEIVDVEPVAGYLGGSVIAVWERLAPLVSVERGRRGNSADPLRWQAYFENLYVLVQERPLGSFRSGSPRWKLSPSQ
jgi:hypothetical protein